MRITGSNSLKVFAIVLAVVFMLVGLQAFAQSGASSLKKEKIAFIRSGDVWLMNTDGSDQKPLVGGIGNAKGSMSWEPGNKRIAFSRAGKVDLKYPEGTKGFHSVYDLFYAFTDSTNNFWMGFTETLGAQSPSYSLSGAKIAFTYDRKAAQANATGPEYRIGIYDTKTRAIQSAIELPRGELTINTLNPAISPDGSKVACLLTVQEKGTTQSIGIVVLPTTGTVTMSEQQIIADAKKWPNATSPSWSPDGQWIAFVNTDVGASAVFVIRPDLTGKRALWTAPAGMMLHNSPPAWSPDSKKLAFATNNGAIYTINLDGTGATKISGPGSDQCPAWSK